MADIYIHYGENLVEMTRTLLERAEVEKRLKPSMKVVLKPNLVVSRPAEGGATTHPEIVEGIIQFLQECGVKDITVAEGAWVGDSTSRAFANCGYRDLEKRYGVKLVDTKKDKVVKKTFQKMEIPLCASCLEADYLINIPVLKGHCQTDMTCCLKNMKGCIPDSEKRRFHTMGLHRPIAALGGIIRPDLHIVDSVCGDLTFEEGGNPVESGRILLGFDGVLLDSYCARLMGYHPDEIQHLRIAREFGLGAYAGEATEILELGGENKPKNSMVRSSVAKGLGKWVEEDGACSACYAALMFALNKTGGRRLPDRIKIGQGFQGRVCDGVGVGNCTSGCGQYVRGCPPKAVDIVDFLRDLR